LELLAYEFLELNILFSEVGMTVEVKIIDVEGVGVLKGVVEVVVGGLFVDDLFNSVNFVLTQPNNVI